MDSDRRISSFSVIVAFVAIAIACCALAFLLPVRLSPSDRLPAITVSFSMSGSNSKVVEEEATRLLEGVLAHIGRVKNIHSRSGNGWGTVTLEFDRSMDIDKARFLTAMAIRRIWNSMPSNASYPDVTIQRLDDAKKDFMIFSINAHSPTSEIMDYANSRIVPALSSIKGVSNVGLTGSTPMEWHIKYDPDFLDALGITITDVSEAIESATSKVSIGLAQMEGKDKGSVRVYLSPSTRATDSDLRKTVVVFSEKAMVTLGQIATVTREEASPSGYFRINGRSSVYINISADDDANQIMLSHEVTDMLNTIELPAGYDIIPVYDASQHISSELDKTLLRTIITVFILLFFVGIATLSWRYLIMTAISLAITIAIAAGLWYLFGVEIQLYSLAGIAISLNLVIDNIIVMSENFVRGKSRRTFMAILTATMTTIGALSIIFLLDENTMLNLKDFAIVIIINLFVSLSVSLFLVPALVETLGISMSKPSPRKRRFSLLMMSLYRTAVFSVCRFRWMTALLLTVAFGISLWLFIDKVYDGYYFNHNPEDPEVNITATMPNGASLEQMNRLVREMEKYISEQSGVKLFQTDISSPRRASITVTFSPEILHTGYPYRFKTDVISKALTLGGAGWGVYGLENSGFSNDVNETAGEYRIKLSGYNYDVLSHHAEALKDTLLKQRRIKDVSINSDFSYFKDDYTEFRLIVDRQALANDSLTIEDIYRALENTIGKNRHAGKLQGIKGHEYINLSSALYGRDVWGFMNIPFRIGDRTAKLSDFAVIERIQTAPDIVKDNNEYVLCLQYEYIGNPRQGRKNLLATLEQFNLSLPIGYKAEIQDYSSVPKNKWSKYWMLSVIVVIIYFITAILFNSLTIPLAVIAVIPVSFIGLFLTFYLFGLKFDHGGFAALILLCGITVNAAIYILNEYYATDTSNYSISATLRYIHVVRMKISAIMLTVLSTVLGFIPFLIDTEHESFWFPLAAGTIGGLIMSLVAILFLLPILILPRTHKHGMIYK